MIKVITYGTYDMFHYGHRKLLERAKALGDYLIVGITSDDYDMTRGKINSKQSLMERIEAVRKTGLADEIIVEEYEGQKIDDIIKYDIDIFTVGSDWEGFFDYLNDYCKVIYLPRTKGISSTDLREENRLINLGIVGDTPFLNKVWRESQAVNGMVIKALCSGNQGFIGQEATNNIEIITGDYEKLLSYVDAVYIRSSPEFHYDQIKCALNQGKHVLCESPTVLSRCEADELIRLADSKHLVMMEAIKTAYATAYQRLLLLIKAGKVGDVVSVDSTCTSLKASKNYNDWSNIYEWGPTALLPIFQILGTHYNNAQIITQLREGDHDGFTKIDFVFDHAVASIKTGDGVKSEGELIISGTQGYIYVPAPWWKTDYFEVRYENPSDNKRYFYQLEGEGIRYELVAFARAIEHEDINPQISNDVTLAIAGIMENYVDRDKVIMI